MPRSRALWAVVSVAVLAAVAATCVSCQSLGRAVISVMGDPKKYKPAAVPDGGSGAGALPATSCPIAVSLVLTSSAAIARRSSALSRSTMAVGVPAGATMPNQPATSKPGRPDSATLGMSGRTEERCFVVTASTLTRPDRIGVSAVDSESNMICTWPAIRST